MTELMSDEEFERRLMERLGGADRNGANDTAHAAEAGSGDAADLLAMTEALESYRERSLHWAAQRSAAMPPPAVPRHAAWLDAPQWALGTVAFCACVVGGALYTHHQAAVLQQAAVALPAAPTQEALLADNELLSSVDHALRSSVAPTAGELGLTKNPGR